MAISVGTRNYNASDLDRRVTFQKFVRVPDGGGGFIQTWVDFVTVWGKIRPIKSSEAWKYGQVTTATRYEVVVRFAPELLDTSMRIVYDAYSPIQFLRYTSAINIDEKRHFMSIAAELEPSAT